MERELKPALLAPEAEAAPRSLQGLLHVRFRTARRQHRQGDGRGGEDFPAPFIPLLAAAPSLGRYTIFGQHFARYGIGSTGAIHRLDRHPSISKHPVTPMNEADLRLHLAKQTKKKSALFDIPKFSLPERNSTRHFVNCSPRRQMWSCSMR